MLEPDRAEFAADPFGYSALAWHQWDFAQALAGMKSDAKDFPDAVDLKSPVLWLSQAHALSEAAVAIFKTRPSWETMPLPVRGICDSQFCAAGIMLVGYSLEICLKGTLILTKGIAAYTSEEKKFQHHNLERLAVHVPGLSEKDKVILRVLTNFTEWAGRYPDPGTARTSRIEEIFTLSERHQIAGRDLFDLARRVMAHVHRIVDDLKI